MRLRKGKTIAFRPKILGEGPSIFIRKYMSKILTVRELSEYLRVHSTTVYRLLKHGKLPAFKVGSDWRFNVEEIDRWQRGQEGGGLVEQNL
jgi:excisionase family DNA binding protein